MASIFTYDPDPPRVASPWSTPRAVTPRIPVPGINIIEEHAGSAPEGSLLEEGGVMLRELEMTTITRLEAEPQEGPTEYKLHLLLRPRRSFVRTSTGRNVPGSYRDRAGSLTPPSVAIRRASDSVILNETGSASATSAAASLQARQHRLEQLTTQLLWRLQQSSPYHSSAANNLILPQLPEASSPQLAPAKPCNLLPGLEESRGALYEIGVSDDGTFVGLAEDELQESLTNLGAMAASLGCEVEVLRKVPVGECQWYDLVSVDGRMQKELRRGKLYVAEALVKPAINAIKERSNSPEGSAHVPTNPAADRAPDVGGVFQTPMPHSPQQQLRVSLTGATMSGKSSLLGSLSTATLDNGRGKSRLSLLKHRHEIASGMTSSVTQELVGYQTSSQPNEHVLEPVQVINYASDNVSAWTDIHERAENGRIVFLSDSAGHPRYRRTTLRGLVGWAPHWTLLCIPADNVEDTSGKSGSTPPPQEVLGTATADIDLSQTHLELCLKLELPLVVVITKLDLASKLGLRQTLSKLLSTIKASGRKPVIIPDTAYSVSEGDIQAISVHDMTAIRKVTIPLQSDHITNIPILLTSAVKGTGIGKLHAFLRELPIMSPAESPREVTGPSNIVPSPLFHIEDIYSKMFPSKPNAVTSATLGSVISGYLRYGTLHVGDELILGPFATDSLEDESLDNSDSLGPPRQAPKRSISDVQTSRSFPGALHKSATYQARTNPAPWRRVRIVSLRNLRLPVRTLRVDQVGTIGIEPISPEQPIATPALVRIRKGMILAGASTEMPKPRRVFDVHFRGPITGVTIGSAVVVYLASVRASAKVVAISLAPGPTAPSITKEHDEDDAFGFGFDDHHDDQQTVEDQEPGTLMTFQFLASREYVESGSQVLVMPGGGPVLGGGTERGEKGVAGLEGFVGHVC